MHYGLQKTPGRRYGVLWAVTTEGEIMNTKPEQTRVARLSEEVFEIVRKYGKYGESISDAILRLIKEGARNVTGNKGSDTKKKS